MSTGKRFSLNIIQLEYTLIALLTAYCFSYLYLNIRAYMSWNKKLRPTSSEHFWNVRNFKYRDPCNRNFRIIAVMVIRIWRTRR